MVAIRALEVARLYIPVVFLWQATAQDLDGWWALLLHVLFWCYTYSRVQAVFVEWWTTRFRVTAQGVHLSTGLIVRRDLAVGWDDVASVQTSRPLFHRVLRCAAVRIGTGSQGRILTLEAVRDDVAEAIEELFRSSRGAQAVAVLPTSAGGAGQPSHDADVEPGRPTSRTEDVVYRIGAWDYLLISVTYGQFVLFVPFVLGAYTEVSRWVHLPTPDLLTAFSGSSWWSLLLVVVATVIGAVAYGCAVAWLRYRSFTARLDDGGLSVSGGFVSQDRRRILRAQIGGLRIEQNPLMRVLGYGKLSVVSRESGRRAGTQVLFPAVPMQRLSRSADDLFPSYAGARGVAPPRRLLAVLLAGTAIVGFVLAASFVHWVRPGAAVVALVGYGLAGMVIANRLWTSVQLTPAADVVSYRRGFLWVTQYALPIASVHVVRDSQGPLGRRCAVRNVSLWVYDGRRLRLRMLTCPEELAVRLTAAVRDQPTPVAQEKCVSTLV